MQIRRNLLKLIVGMRYDATTRLLGISLEVDLLLNGG